MTTAVDCVQIRYENTRIANAFTWTAYPTWRGEFTDADQRHLQDGLDHIKRHPDCDCRLKVQFFPRDY